MDELSTLMQMFCKSVDWYNSQICGCGSQSREVIKTYTVRSMKFATVYEIRHVGGDTF